MCTMCTKAFRNKRNEKAKKKENNNTQSYFFFVEYFSNISIQNTNFIHMWCVRACDNNDGNDNDNNHNI